MSITFEPLLVLIRTNVYRSQISQGVSDDDLENVAGGRMHSDAQFANKFLKTKTCSRIGF